jgi:excisionase family DNA binding protein
MTSKGETNIPRAAFTVREACQALTIGRSKFYEEVDAGRIRTIKCGRRTLVPATEPTRYLLSLSEPVAQLNPPRARGEAQWRSDGPSLRRK